MVGMMYGGIVGVRCDVWGMYAGVIYEGCCWGVMC